MLYMFYYKHCQIPCQLYFNLTRINFFQTAYTDYEVIRVINMLDSIFFHTAIFVPRTSQMSLYPTRETAFAVFSCGSSNINVLGMGISMRRLRHYILTGIFFVLITGTLAHFLYDWSKNNNIVGFFTPVNESTWEHMKLLFFPMLLFSLLVIPKLKENYQCITTSLLSGILIGTALIPIIFYTYTGILGYNVFILDLFTFILAVIIAFYIVYKFTLSCQMQKHTALLFVAICVLFICFLLFTYQPPNIGLFHASF